MKARIVELKSEYPTGKSVYYDVALSDKTVGKLVIPLEDKGKYKEGDEINYTKENAQSKAGKSYNKITIVSDSQPTSQPADNSPYQINRVVFEAPSKALDAATTSFAGQNKTDQDIINRADVFYNWLADKLTNVTK